MNLPECGLSKTHKEIVRIMVFSIPYLKDGQATSNTKARAPLPGFSRVIWDEWGKKRGPHGYQGIKEADGRRHRHGPRGSRSPRLRHLRIVCDEQ